MINQKMTNPTDNKYAHKNRSDDVRNCIQKWTQRASKKECNDGLENAERKYIWQKQGAQSANEEL